MPDITVIGAGLAGCEAAWQLANNNIHTRLIDMKPVKFSPAHKAEGFAELVCSNSLRSDSLENASGLLKAEMRLMGSITLEAADKTSVPAGGALAVNREDFSAYITEKVKSHPFIEFESREITSVSEIDGPVIIATGPLTSEPLAKSIAELTGEEGLNFYDAAAPIVTRESIDFDSAFEASRYGKGNGSDYLNCPLNKEEYDEFHKELISARCAGHKDYEKNVFEGCMPVEVMAKRGPSTLLFGPLKPVGLTDPSTGFRPYAAVQLRKEDKDGRLYNLVGFQTNLAFPEQKRVFSMIPALKNAEFVRYGVMHLNTYINSPRLLDKFYRLRSNTDIYFAGQITGVEGYMESASSGLLAGFYAAHLIKGIEPPVFSDKTAIGALATYVSSSVTGNFQPMNINYGIIAPTDVKIKNKKDRAAHIAERALNEIKGILNEHN